MGPSWPGSWPPFHPLAAASMPAKCLPNHERALQATLLFPESRLLNRGGSFVRPAAVAFKLTQVKSALGGMRILRAKSL